MYKINQDILKRKSVQQFYALDHGAKRLKTTLDIEEFRPKEEPKPKTMTSKWCLCCCCILFQCSKLYNLTIV